LGRPLINFGLNLLRRNSGPTVPSMDGALKPNQDLERADLIEKVPDPDNLVEHGGRVLFSVGNEIRALSEATPNAGSDVVQRCAGTVTALAANLDGGLAAGLDPGGISLIEGRYAGLTLAKLGDRDAFCVTALGFDGPDHLLVCLGSTHNRSVDWQRDLLERRCSGSVWRVDLKTREAICIAAGLAFPNGVLRPAGSERIIISESWGHRLIELAMAKRSTPRIVLDDLPGYPGRLTAASSSGAWLAIFAPRNQLVEHVLRETTYRTWMIKEIAPEYWVAPALRSGLSFKEPLQRGAVRTQGIFKAWAPTRSYGLLVRLGADMDPMFGLHSRADGARHGVTSCVETGGRIIIASKGGHAILATKAARGGGG
jgi:hypothetical protein